MKKPLQEKLRLALVIRSGEEEIAETMISAWRDAFSEVAPEGIRFCLWITGENPADSLEIDACVHTLALNPLIDGYQRTARHRTIWSPWGQKSGPNFQFFRIMRLMSNLHSETWLLQLELDTFPLRKISYLDVSHIVEDDVWVAGPMSPESSNKSFGGVTPQHINGAAFYKFGDPDFIDFVCRTWAPSLLYTLRMRPAVAYDVINSPANTEKLPEELKNRWLVNRNRFMGVAGMGINVGPGWQPLDEINSDYWPEWFTHNLGGANNERL